MIQAMTAAGLWGCTDVLAGVSARRSTPLLAALWLHIASLAVLAPFLLIWHRPIAADALLFGVLAGVAAAIGDVLLGRALARSVMTVGIPLANVIAAAIPALVVVAQGEPISVIGAAGVLGALVASALAVAPSNGRLAMQGAGYAGAAGICFGTMYALLAQTGATDTLMVVFVMRLAGTLALLPGLAQAGQRKLELVRAGAVSGVASGLASVGANVLFILAMASGESRVATSVIAIALSAPAAMLIVHLMARERLTILQGASSMSAMLAIAALAVPQNLT